MQKDKKAKRQKDKKTQILLDKKTTKDKKKDNKDKKYNNYKIDKNTGGPKGPHALCRS